MVSEASLRNLKEKVVGQSEQNNRNIMPDGDREVLSYNTCPKFVTDVVPPAMDIDAQRIKATIKQNWYGIVYPGTKTMFDDVSTGAFTYNKPKYFMKNDSHWEEYNKMKSKAGPLDMSKFNNQFYKLEGIKEDEMEKISPQVRQDLRFQLGEWLVNNRAKIMEREQQNLDEKYGKDKIDGEMV